MASMKDKLISDFLSNLYHNKKGWIGARRKKNSKEFVWGDKSPVNPYIRGIGWANGEPKEDCTVNSNPFLSDTACVSSSPPPGFFCEMDTVAAVVKGDRGEWPGHPKDAWAVQNLLKKNKKGVKEGKDKKGVFNYWLLPNGATNKGFILDFGFVKAFNLVQVVNTHSAEWRDRATKKFKVYLR